MNKGGFTLVELLMTIVILGIVLSLAVPGVLQVSKSIRENQRQNIIKNIEIAAGKYAFDTGETSCYVQDLITNGYIKADEGEKKVIKDPTNPEENFNCYIVTMTKINDRYEGKFTNISFDTEEETDCNSNNLINKIDITASMEDGTPITIESGIIDIGKGSNIKLKGQDEVCDGVCTWSSTNGLYEKNYEVTLNNIQTSGTYTFSQITDHGLYQESVRLNVS